MLLHDVLGFDRTRDLDGDRTVLIAADGGRSIGRAELRTQAAAVAELLKALGIEPGDRIAILGEKTPEVVAAFLGASLAGIVYVPLDPAAGPAYWTRILAELDIRVLLAREPAALGDLAPVRVVALPQFGRAARAPAPEDILRLSPPSRSDSDAAYVLPTSGSTGTPKGVVLSHQNALAFVRWAADTIALQPGDTVLGLAPFHFDLSVFDVYASLLCDAPLVLAPPQAAVFPGEFISVVETNRVTVLYSVPAVLRLLLDAGAFADGAGRSLRTIMYAGEPFPVPALRRLMAALPHVDVYNFFGPTETNVCLAERLAAPPASDDVEVPIGVPASGAQITLVDDDGRPAGDGEVGEIVVDGPTVMLGYQTARGFAPAARPYRTGDFALRGASGSLLFRGRRDDMVKVGGQRIELKAVESVLEGVPGVAEVAVFAGDDQLVALVAAPNGVEVAALRMACRASLPPGSMPHRFLFVEDLPRLSNGKLDRRRLAAYVTEPASNAGEGSRGRSLEPETRKA